MKICWKQSSLLLALLMLAASCSHIPFFSQRGQSLPVSSFAMFTPFSRIIFSEHALPKIDGIERDLKSEIEKQYQAQISLLQYPATVKPFSKEVIDDAPAITIDPRSKDNPATFLTDMCRKQNLQGIILGHFEEDYDTRTVYFGVHIFFAADQSFRSIDSRFGVDETRMILPGLIRSLAASISSTLPAVQGNIFVPSPPSPTSTPQPHIPPSQSSSLSYVVDVYSLIINRGFFCTFAHDNNDLQAIARKLGTPEDAVLRALADSAWITTFQDRLNSDPGLGGLANNLYVEVMASRYATPEVIKLYLHPLPQKANWSEAQQFVAQLNQQRYAGFTGWRLPTLEELLAIFQYFPQQNNQGVYFPFTQLAFPDSDNIRIWSSTPSLQENRAHWVMAPTIRGKFEVTFDAEKDQNRKAVILAVRTP